MGMDIEPEQTRRPASKKTAADWNQQLGEIFLFFLGAAGSALFLWIVISALGWLLKRL